MKVAFVLWLCLAFVESCHDNCKCSKYKIFCKDSRIRSLPQGLPTTQTLSMDGDILEYLNASVFLSNHGLRNLTTLVLTNLQIQGIENCTFATQRNLESLTIRHNNLSDLSAGAFIGLDKLYLLDLSDNNLETLPLGIFEQLGTLRYLNLTFNKISVLNLKMFKGLSQKDKCTKGESLKRIDLGGNPLTSIPGAYRKSFYCVREFTVDVNQEYSSFKNPSIFQNLHSLHSIKGNNYIFEGKPLRGLKHLTHINISYSQIPKIPKKFLPDSANLKVLWLTNSYIHYLESNCFHGLLHLSNLNLHGNSIEDLEDNIFQKLIDLRYLTLSNNHLTSINNNTFSGLFKLRYLNLDNNELTFLQQNTFSLMPELKELLLGGNLFESFDSLAFSDLPSLIILRVSMGTHYTTTNVTLDTLQRLDSFEGPYNFDMKNLQVLNYLKVEFSDSAVPHYFQNHIKAITYLNNPIAMELINLEEAKRLNFLTGINIFNLTIKNYNNFFLKPSSLASLPDLKSLSIYSNSKSVIQQDGLKNQQHLEDLTLHFLDVPPDLRRGIFKGLINLKRLNIYYNPNRAQNIFTRQTFDGLKNIQQIVIEGFNIKTLTNLFVDLQTLEILILKDNEVLEVSSGAFLGLKKIQTLDLSENSISSIGIGVFGAVCRENFTLTCANLTYLSKYCNTSYSLENLEYLNLESNNISSIHRQAFLGCNKLKSLKLNYNQIGRLDFLYLPQLMMIQLRGSNISNLSNNTFRCTPALQDVSFFVAFVEQFELSAITHLKYLKRLILPYKSCDCHYRNIWKWLRNRNIQYRQPNTIWNFHLHLCNDTDMDVHLSKLECNSSSESKLYKPENTTSTSNTIFYFKTYVEPIVLIFIFITGSFGNGLVLYVIFRHSDLRNMNNACIAQLAFAEILSLILNIALSYWDVANNTWELNETSCKMFIMSKDLVVSLVVLTVLALTLERFMVVRASFKLKSLNSFRDFGPTLLLVTVWIYSVVTSIPSYVSATLYNRCLPSPPGTDYEKKTLAFQLTVNSLIPVFFIIVLNIATAYMLKKSIDKVQGKFGNTGRYKKRDIVANTVNVLSVVFTLSYLPNSILRTIVSWFSWSVWANEDIFWYSFVSYSLFFMHTVFNPFAIMVMGSKFRVHILEIISSFKKDKADVPETPDIQKSIKGPCQFLLNLGEGFAGSKNKSCAQQITLAHGLESVDDAVRRARQERLNKIQERMRMRL